jgi:hypothetical protein
VAMIVASLTVAACGFAIVAIGRFAGCGNRR